MKIAGLVFLALAASAFGQLPHRFSIPTVDLSGETQRQVIVDREAGQYLGHVTTVLLEDGKTILAVYPKGHGRGAIVYKRSTDGGLTWSDRLPTPKSWDTSLEVPTIHRVVDAAGKKRLILFSGLYPIRMAVSEDDGATWGELKPIGNFGGIVTMASVVPLQQPGHYMALFHDDGCYIIAGSQGTVKSASGYSCPKGKAGRFWVYQTRSTDGGLTWSAAVPIASLPDADLCEPGAVRSPDGKEITVLLRENRRRHLGYFISSKDEGLTWTEPKEMSAALTGDRHTARYAPDGRLFVTFRDKSPESPTPGDWVGWVGHYEDIAAGREGEYRVRLMHNTYDGDCAYPGLELLPDGTFVTTTYGHWAKDEPPYITSVRFKMEDLDAKAPKP